MSDESDWKLIIVKETQRLFSQIELLPPQLGDMPSTFASIDKIRAAVGFEPKVSLETGLKNFVSWFREYYDAKSLTNKH